MSGMLQTASSEGLTDSNSASPSSPKSLDAEVEELQRQLAAVEEEREQARSDAVLKLQGIENESMRAEAKAGDELRSVQLGAESQRFRAKTVSFFIQYLIISSLTYHSLRVCFYLVMSPPPFFRS